MSRLLFFAAIIYCPGAIRSWRVYLRLFPDFIIIIIIFHLQSSRIVFLSSLESQAPLVRAGDFPFELRHCWWRAYKPGCYRRSGGRKDAHPRWGINDPARPSDYDVRELEGSVVPLAPWMPRAIPVLDCVARSFRL
jgi:hypothetical protein